MKHITLKQEKTSALELKTFCSWSLNTVNVWYSEGGEISCWDARKMKKKKSLLFLLLCVLTELLLQAHKGCPVLPVPLPQHLPGLLLHLSEEELIQF